MLRCCAGICGGSFGSAAAPSAGELAAPEVHKVVKPVVRLDEPEEAAVSRPQDLATRFGLVVGPPGADPPAALVTPDFQKNSTRLLVLVPSSGSPLGAWDLSLPGSNGTVAVLLRWAQANCYAVVVFSAQELEASPAGTWDRVLRGSPAKCVSVLVAKGMTLVLEKALLPVHPLLYGRFRTVCVRDATGWPGTSPFLNEAAAEASTELLSHLRAAAAHLPAGWELREHRAAHQQLFELLQEREDRWQRAEMRKYAGFQDLKENDMPGFRRLPVDQRIQRLDRDRENDELARLLHKHEKAAGAESEEEPGVD